MKARIGNDSDQRRSALSGRMSRTRSVSEEGVPARCAQMATASSVHGRKAPSSRGRLSLHARPADSAELVEGPGDEAGRGEQRGALPEPAAVGRSYIGDEQQQRRGAGETDEGRESANHATRRPCMGARLAAGANLAQEATRQRGRRAGSAARAWRVALRATGSGAGHVHDGASSSTRQRRRRLEPARAQPARRAVPAPRCASPAMGGSSPLDRLLNPFRHAGGDDPHHPRRVDLLHLRRRRRDHRRRAWILCGRHAISLATCAENQRRATDAALGRQGRVLRGRVLPAQPPCRWARVRTIC